MLSWVLSCLALPALAHEVPPVADWQLYPYAYQFEGEDYPHVSWPESNLPELKNKASIGLAFSGGGTRAQIAAMGQLRGLMDLGILDQAKYITGISGGSWASASFVFANVTREIYLGDLLAPEDITMDALGKTTEGAGRYFAVNKDFITAIPEILLAGYDVGEVWYRAVSEVFLEPAGVKWGSFFTWSDREKADILKRNPELAGEPWTTTREGAPYLITVSSLRGPECSKRIRANFTNRTETLMETTPLYVGEAHTRHETYFGTPVVTHQVGGFVESFGFGATASNRSHLPAGKSGEILEGVKTNHLSCGSASKPRPGQCSWNWAIGHAVGASSWAPGLFLSQHPILQGLDLDLPYWSPATPLSPADAVGDDGPCGRYILADGGCTSNVYISGLIKRGVKTVIAFMNTETPLAPNFAWDPSKDNSTKNHIDVSISSFFGFYGPNDPEYNYNGNQIFPSSDFITVVQALQKSQAAGLGAVAAMDHTTVANSILGIPAGKKVKVVWVYLSRAFGFEDAIQDSDVKKAAFVGSGANRDPRQVKGLGTFWNFPYWNTLSQLRVNKEQANLMSHMQAWIMKKNKDILQEALAHARQDMEVNVFV